MLCIAAVDFLAPDFRGQTKLEYPYWTQRTCVIELRRRDVCPLKSRLYKISTAAAQFHLIERFRDNISNCYRNQTFFNSWLRPERSISCIPSDKIELPFFAICIKIAKASRFRYSVCFALHCTHTWPNRWLSDNSQFQRKLMYGTLLWGARSLLKPRNSWVPVVTQEK